MFFLFLLSSIESSSYILRPKKVPPSTRGSAAFDPRKRHLRPEEAAPSGAGSAAFVKHPRKAERKKLLNNLAVQIILCNFAHELRNPTPPGNDFLFIKVFPLVKHSHPIFQTKSKTNTDYIYVYEE